MAFQKLKVVDQSVLAIYFDKDGVVTRRANYTLKDGKVFDTITRVTPTGGKRPHLPAAASVRRQCRQRSQEPLRWRRLGRPRRRTRPACAKATAFPQEKPAGVAPAGFFSWLARLQAQESPSSSSATMLVILIAGLTAGPAVSL